MGVIIQLNRHYLDDVRDAALNALHLFSCWASFNLLMVQVLYWKGAGGLWTFPHGGQVSLDRVGKSIIATDWPIPGLFKNPAT